MFTHSGKMEKVAVEMEGSGGGGSFENKFHSSKFIRLAGAKMQKNDES